MHLEGGGAEEYKAVNNGNSRARIKHFPTLRLFCLVMMKLIRFGFFFFVFVVRSLMNDNVFFCFHTYNNETLSGNCILLGAQLSRSRFLVSNRVFDWVNHLG